jgi:hypothetical protein
MNKRILYVNINFITLIIIKFSKVFIEINNEKKKFLGCFFTVFLIFIIILESTLEVKTREKISIFIILMENL